MIYDKDGNELGDIPISERNAAALQDGQEVVVQFHLPRMLQGEHTAASGSFRLRRDGERIVSDDVAAVRDYAGMQSAITALRARVLPELE